MHCFFCHTPCLLNCLTQNTQWFPFSHRSTHRHVSAQHLLPAGQCLLSAVRIRLCLGGSVQRLCAVRRGDLCVARSQLLALSRWYNTRPPSPSSFLLLFRSSITPCYPLFPPFTHTTLPPSHIPAPHTPFTNKVPTRPSERRRAAPARRATSPTVARPHARCAAGDPPCRCSLIHTPNPLHHIHAADDPSVSQLLRLNPTSNSYPYICVLIQYINPRLPSTNVIMVLWYHIFPTGMVLTADLMLLLVKPVNSV